MQGTEAQDLYNSFLQQLGQKYRADRIKDGKFGAYMQVHIQNDGPVTLELDSEPKRSDEKDCVFNIL
uniref:D-aminoacyl-tRNA deacylase n=1 Tax=Lutzomyia longipalpis TaxID=7200 RepID=A0A1B0CS65_LUTLO